MIKLLLTSDIHLGRTEAASRIPESARVTTFRRICALAREHDMLLVAGDLFDGSNPPRELVQIVAEEFKTLREMNVAIVYAPGEHELLEDDTTPSFLTQINPSHLFSGAPYTNMFFFTRNGQEVYVYGFPAARRNGIGVIARVEKEGFHIGLFHADFGADDEAGSARMHVLQRSDIRSLGLDFYAMGHHHQFQLFKYRNRIIGAYPGSPEAVEPDETGDRYVLSISVENNEIHQIKRFEVNSLRIGGMRFDCGTITSSSPILDALDRQKSPKTAMLLVLDGERNFHLNLQEIRACSHDFFSLGIEDRSVPTMEILIGEYASENTLRGELFSLLKERIAGKGLPPGIDARRFVKTLHLIARQGRYTPEAWL